MMKILNWKKDGRGKRFVSWIVLVLFCLGINFLYVKFIYRVINGFSGSQSNLFLVVLVCVSLLISMEVNVIGNRFINFCIFMLIPYGLYTVISYFQLFPTLFFYFLIITLGIATLTTLILIALVNDRRKDRIICFNAFLIVGALASLLLIAAVVVNDVMYKNGWLESEQSIEKTVTREDIEALYFIDQLDLSTLSSDEQLELAQKIIELEKRNLGIAKDISIEMKNLGIDGATAYYQDGRSRIVLNKSVLNDYLTGYEFVNIST